jgi:hypothetical protein
LRPKKRSRKIGPFRRPRLYAAKGYHPSDYRRGDYRRPWCDLEWIRMIDYDHACQYVQRLADVIFGPGPESQRWAKRMREQWKSRANGVARVLPLAAALRHHRGLGGQAKVSAYLYKRSRWMRFQSYRRHLWLIGSETTEVACKIVFAQRLKRSGMSWTISGGQGILELCVIW